MCYYQQKRVGMIQTKLFTNNLKMNEWLKSIQEENNSFQFIDIKMSDKNSQSYSSECDYLVIYTI